MPQELTAIYEEEAIGERRANRGEGRRIQRERGGWVGKESVNKDSKRGGGGCEGEARASGQVQGG